jgi:hypothetical protein
MFNLQTSSAKLKLTLRLASVALLVSMIAGPVQAAGSNGHGGADITTAPVHWWFDAQKTPVGRSTLVRSPSGLTAIFSTNGLEKGHVYTLWFMFWNHPEECISTPCSTIDDLGTFFTNFEIEETEGDFHYGSGLVSGKGKRVVFGGHLRINELSTSGNIEIELPGFPLLNPRGAEVLLAIHSHGPKLSGADLRSQLDSYLGGCDVFTTASGFAETPGDVPDELGECSTIQYSLHLPPGN